MERKLDGIHSIVMVKVHFLELHQCIQYASEGNQVQATTSGRMEKAEITHLLN